MLAPLWRLRTAEPSCAPVNTEVKASARLSISAGGQMLYMHRGEGVAHRLRETRARLEVALGGTRTPNLLIRSSMCGHSAPFRSVRDLGPRPVPLFIFVRVA